MREKFIRVGNHVYQFPKFRHDFGDSAHHMSMIRTCDFDEDGSPIRGTGPNDIRFLIHELLDNWIFYPIQHWLRNWIEDGKLYHTLTTILGFFWGLNCNFPPRDVVLYTAWYYRGCKPVKVFTLRGEK